MASQAQDQLGTYSPEDVIITLHSEANGANKGFTHVINGVADGTFVTVTMSVAQSTLVSGSDVTNYRIKRKNRSASINLTLTQSSESNDFLSQLWQNDANASRNDWVFSLTIKDASGRSLYEASQAFIGNIPDSEFSSADSTRQWVFTAANLRTYIGGNANVTESTVADMTAIGGSIDSSWQA